MARDDIRRFIAAQRTYTESHYPAILAEIRGIAAGFGLSDDLLFDYLHCSTAMDMTALSQHEADGCTSFAVATPAHGALLAKNRDYRDEHSRIQRVMRHTDPAWSEREILVLGSLGSPGNFSSGINKAGLAVSDTASRTADMGIGFHRYFLLTWLLVHCATVDEALAAIGRITHTGGGLLVLADASGTVAAVELGHRRVGIDRGCSGRVGRTNHFLTLAIAAAERNIDYNASRRANSIARWTALDPLLKRLPAGASVQDATGLLQHHDPHNHAGFCRHGGDDLSTTISGAVYVCRERRLYAAFGQPCCAAWQRYELPSAAAEDVTNPSIQPSEPRR
jgi:predicted choloylglycine hydrolase